MGFEEKYSIRKIIPSAPKSRIFPINHNFFITCFLAFFMNEVYETETFSKLYDAAEKVEQDWIDKIKDHLGQNLRTGQPLRFDWFREKKLGDKRLFYLINEQTHKAILISFGSKKEQQQIINHIIINKEKYLSLIR